MARTLSIPTHSPPSTPGEILEEEFRKPLGLTQEQLANALGVQRGSLNLIINGRRSVTPEMALRLSRVLGTSVELWLNLQQMTDIYEAQHSPQAKAIAKLPPLKMAARG